MAAPRLLAVALCTAAATVSVTGLCGCASRSGGPPLDRPETPIGSSWVSTQQRDHPLAGKIWDGRRRAFVSEQELNAAVRGAGLLLLGEIHDNPDHHLLQARLVRVLTSTGRRPAIAFEMLDETQQAAIDRALKSEPRDPSALAEAVHWDESGWPPFKLYRPIFEAAADAGLPVVAANLPRTAIREASRKGVQALPADVRMRIERQGPLPEAIRQEMREEMAESHCGELPESMLDPLIVGQRARDAQMASRVVAGATADGSILVTGAEHARLDRGVPTYLSPDEVSKGPIVSIAMREVRADATRPEDYGFAADGPVRADYVIFTPGVAREDPCIQLREQMRKVRPHAPVGEQDGGTQL